MSCELHLRRTEAITVKKIRLWRREIDATPSALANALQPLTDAGIRLQAFMRYRHFRDERRAVIEVYPHEAEDQAYCASIMRAAGLKVSDLPALLIEGGEMPLVEYAITQVIAEHNLDLVFCVTQQVNEKWVAIMGFVGDADADKAALSFLRLKVDLPVTEYQPIEHHLAE